MCKKQSADVPCRAYYSDNDRFRQLVIDVVPAVLDGDYAAAFQMRNNGDRFAAVAAEGKQEGLQILVVSINPLNYVFLAF